MQELEHTLDLTHEEDIRHTEPNIDGLRLRTFTIGWDDATLRNHIYTKDTFRQLTWQNLGNRIGAILRGATPELQDKMYDLCVEIQAEQAKNRHQ